MDIRYVEAVAASLVREYLSRKGLKKTLLSMENEAPRGNNSINNRADLARTLNVDKLLNKNEESKYPLKTLIELIAYSYLEKSFKGGENGGFDMPMSTRGGMRNKLSELVVDEDVESETFLGEGKAGLLEHTESDEMLNRAAASPSGRGKAQRGGSLGFAQPVMNTREAHRLNKARPSMSGSGQLKHDPTRRASLASEAVLPEQEPHFLIKGSSQKGQLGKSPDVKAAGTPSHSRPVSRAGSQLDPSGLSGTKPASASRSASKASSWFDGERTKDSNNAKGLFESEPPKSNVDKAASYLKKLESKPNDGLDFETALSKLAKNHPVRRAGTKEKDNSGSSGYSVDTSSISSGKMQANRRPPSESGSGMNLDEGESGSDDGEVVAAMKELAAPATARPTDTFKPALIKQEGKPIDATIAAELKTLIFGSSTAFFTDEWRKQGFTFCDLPRLQYGIVQKKGGPCGVLASVQANMLLHLLFGDPDNKPTNKSLDPNKLVRSEALARGLAFILWRAGDSVSATVVLPGMRPLFPSTTKCKTDGITEYLSLYTLKSLAELGTFIRQNINVFEMDGGSGVILSLYSVILSRSISKVRQDMDMPTNTLMGAHGYCTQEMVNLYLTGHAASNVFNDKIVLDPGSANSTTLKGIHKRADIGLLSLFEHYKSCEVGKFLKVPRYPIFVVCSESHFSVLFCLKRNLVNDWKAERRFDLYYYDGLARQENEIRLTIDTTNRYYEPPSEEELVPPLEHCIRTKWPGCEIDWNGTEPLL